MAGWFGRLARLLEDRLPSELFAMCIFPMFFASKKLRLHEKIPSHQSGGIFRANDGKRPALAMNYPAPSGTMSEP